jgi:DNA-binding MarR family transcriptional regulator
VPKKVTLTKAEFEALAAFRYALRRFLRFSENAAQHAGLTPQQHQALLAIKGFPGRAQITLSELAERLQLRHHSTVGLANRLVASRLAVRRRGSVDRRQVYLALTRRGEQLLARLSTAHREQLRHLSPQLEALLKELRR